LRLLIDSHPLLWFVRGDRKKLSGSMRARIEEGESLVSIASLWEIAIKSCLGKLQAPEDLPERVQDLGFEPLPIAIEHAWRVRDLPHYHRDPVDRLLIAQAQAESVPILTSDRAFADYDVSVVWD
jgi:PIN domain nuclease of toxin-antitoxin system